MLDGIIKGGLFSTDFTSGSIAETADYQEIDQAYLAAFEAQLIDCFEKFPHASTPNETQTEDDLIWPVLSLLGWQASLRQQNLSVKGRDHVPDGLLFADDSAKTQANSFGEEWRRYELGLAVVESKRWARPLDRQSGRRGEETAPSTQMLRYLRRVDDITSGKLRWGILTNGCQWRLYWQGARSISEQFFDFNLAALLNLPGHDLGLFTPSDEERRHALKVFWLMFRREAFLPSTHSTLSFHRRALDQARFYEERVAENLSKIVFNEVFPKLCIAVANAAPQAPLETVRHATLILLYRLLFILYAEDRSLLPVRDPRYDDYGLRQRVRLDVKKRKDVNDTFSTKAARYWHIFADLCRALDEGDPSIGLPPYNGGLFSAEATPLLTQIHLHDAVMADVIDALSFERMEGERRYINYRDLSVQQLGSIYERLLEHEMTDQNGTLTIMPNIFARKGSGSYYTPENLVGLVIHETIEPLIKRLTDTFNEKLANLQADNTLQDRALGLLKTLDPAEKVLELKICDPAMGSGHFLVSLVDYLADQIMTLMAETEAIASSYEYVSPLTARIENIRNTITANAEERDWTVDSEQLDDRHIIRRMILKRCVYGVDKNPMAVELAKVSLWLHTFTVGAPLSFLDHHLRCGDSLFGLWVSSGIAQAAKLGGELFLQKPIKDATKASSSMQVISSLTDAEISEAHRSKDIFEGVQDKIAPLTAILSFFRALDWLNSKHKAEKTLIQDFLFGTFGDPLDIAVRCLMPHAASWNPTAAERLKDERLSSLLQKVRTVVATERFLHWQVAFPDVWENWEQEQRSGGFDAVIGNPPWDRIKLQQVEWFAGRKREIALASKASDRKKMITALEKANDPLLDDYQIAQAQSEAAARIARDGGEYPLLSKGDINIYSLFVERALQLVKPEGMVGLVVPSGIASDKNAAPFFKGIATTGRLKALYDFENKKVFFPDVHASFKFCIFVAGKHPLAAPARCAFYLHKVDELDDPQRCFTLDASDFARVNPNTGTAPIFRTRRDADLTTAIYSRLPVLVDRSGSNEVKTWPVKYVRMFDMTNDSHLFRTRTELEEQEGAYPVRLNRFKSKNGVWVPLYEGKMVQAYDHRAASVVVNSENQHRPARPRPATPEEHLEPEWLPEPQFWVNTQKTETQLGSFLAFKDVTAPTNMRSMIASIIPSNCAGNTLPLIFFEDNDPEKKALFLANINATVFDFVARQKIQGQHLNWYIVEQLPVIPPETYSQARFGDKTAADIIKPIVLELTYTAHDMAPFAEHMGYTDKTGAAKPPFIWDEERRLHLRAKLDALFFHLYGITDRDDIRYIFSTFPIVEREDTAKYGHYRSCDLCLGYMNALAAGDVDTVLKR